jgi:tRNA threonylcarbamoyladenosine biosynthesis protein TsaE
MSVNLPEIEISSQSPEDTQALGLKLGQSARSGDVYLMAGQLGAGKTCLTQGIAWGLDIREYTASPTFVLVRELYGRLPLYHIDLYRLDNLEEIADLGLDDYFYGRGVSVVEWADKAPGLLPPEHLKIDIEYLGDDRRRLQLTAHGPRYAELLEEIR